MDYYEHLDHKDEIPHREISDDPKDWTEEQRKRVKDENEKLVHDSERDSSGTPPTD
jgi:hypothetical protein